jgi:putative phosphoesterase
MDSSGSSENTSHSPTLLGVLSDTHDRADAAAAGIATLRAAGAQFLIHCGDVGGERILDLLAGIPCAFVWGNNDYDRASLTRYAVELGLQCGGDFAELQFAGKKIAVTHGDSAKLIRNAMAEDAGYDYLFLGHTHIPANDRVGRLRIVNPGALHRAARKTVALVDLINDVVRHLVVRQ